MSGDGRPLGSPFRRVLRLGRLAGRVATSVAASQIAGLAGSAARREERRTENLTLNARRIAETLGELKGAAMKVGQMLSLQDSLLPPEVAAALRTLQKQATPMPFAVVERRLAEELPKGFFASIEPYAFAAASIGQVHRATLRDGRPVAVKVQYPGIDEVIEADLGNLRRVLKTVVGLVVNVDFDPIWRELKARLVEELDYEREAASVQRMAQLHADVPDVVIPGVVLEGTTKSVLTMEYVPAIAPDDACSDRVSQGARDQWGGVLFDFLLRGLFEHRFLHADPNLSNFAFLPDGRVVVFDFGCIKEVPARVARGYRDAARAILADRLDDIPAAFSTMGVQTVNGGTLPLEMVAPGAAVFVDLLRVPGGYRFGNEGEAYDRFFELGSANVRRGEKFKLPRDIVFVNRTLAGHFGNLSRLKAKADWRAHVERFVGR